MATAAIAKRAKRITGIGIAAAALGVTRQHLGLVLHGQRESKPLAVRYRAWKKQQRELRAAIAASVDDQVGIVNEFNAMRRSLPTACKS